MSKLSRDMILNSRRIMPTVIGCNLMIQSGVDSSMKHTKEHREFNITLHTFSASLSRMQGHTKGAKCVR